MIWAMLSTKQLKPPNSGASKNFKQPKWISDATLSCFFRCSNRIRSEVSRKRFYSNNGSHYHFSYDWPHKKVKLYLKIWITKQGQQGLRISSQNAGPSQTSMREGKMEKRETHWEKLREMEKEEGRTAYRKRRFALPMTNQSWKSAWPAVIHCHSYLEKQTGCDNWFDGPAWGKHSLWA